jgi:hypothetical protein
LGVSRSKIAKLEAALRPADRALLLASELLFEVGARELFPALYREAAASIVARAYALEERLRDKAPLRRTTRIFLGHLLERTQVDSKPLCHQLRLFS